MSSPVRSMEGIFDMPYTPPTPEQEHTAALRVLTEAKAQGWSATETVETLQALSLDQVPVVAAAFARHGITPGDAETVPSR